MAAKKNAPNKSAFIRSQPAELSAAEVVEKAKAEGLTIEPGLVYNVRGRAKSLGKAKKAPSARKVPAPLAKKSSNGAKTPASKAAFVRQFPHLTPKEIVEKAEDEGLKLEVGYVYNIRSADKGSHGKAPKAVAARRPSPSRAAASPARAHSASHSNEEELLKIVAAEVGLGRAIEVLQGERARVMAAIGGM